MNREIKEHFQKLDKARKRIREKTERLLDIVEFLKVEVLEKYPKQYSNICIDIDFYVPDIEEILKQKDIENYKIGMYEIAYSLSSIMRRVGINKVQFYRKFKIWLLLNKK